MSTMPEKNIEKRNFELQSSPTSIIFMINCDDSYISQDLSNSLIIQSHWESMKIHCMLAQSIKERVLTSI